MAKGTATKHLVAIRNKLPNKNMRPEPLELSKLFRMLAHLTQNRPPTSESVPNTLTHTLLGAMYYNEPEMLTETRVARRLATTSMKQHFNQTTLAKQLGLNTM